MNCNKSTVYATALLSDGEILFWRVGHSRKSVYDFYKDFMYAGINQSEYIKSHTMETKCMEFSFEDDENYSLDIFVFDKLAPEFFKKYRISADAKGFPPYEC